MTDNDRDIIAVLSWLSTAVTIPLPDRIASALQRLLPPPVIDEAERLRIEQHRAHVEKLKGPRGASPPMQSNAVADGVLRADFLEKLKRPSRAPEPTRTDSEERREQLDQLKRGSGL
jgi:hypothetical protein